MYMYFQTIVKVFCEGLWFLSPYWWQLLVPFTRKVFYMRWTCTGTRPCVQWCLSHSSHLHNTGSTHTGTVQCDGEWLWGAALIPWLAGCVSVLDIHRVVPTTHWPGWQLSWRWEDPQEQPGCYRSKWWEAIIGNMHLILDTVYTWRFPASGPWGKGKEAHVFWSCWCSHGSDDKRNWLVYVLHSLVCLVSVAPCRCLKGAAPFCIR